MATSAIPASAAASANWASSPVPSAVVEVRNLTKRFGDMEAVRGISFTVDSGETFGFLGPNGAGKSTTINMLCTLARPTAGSARVAGFDTLTQAGLVRKHIGLVFQDSTLDTYLTAMENGFTSHLLGGLRKL